MKNNSFIKYCTVISFVLVFSIINGCSLAPSKSEHINPAKWDPDWEKYYEKPSHDNMSEEAKALLQKLLDMRGKGLMLGHNEATQRGQSGGWKAFPKELPYDNEKSDIKEVCGEHPAMLGWDMPYDDEFMGHYMINAYRRGGISLIGWHPNNFASEEEGDSWTIKSDLSLILPGGAKHEYYMTILEERAKLFNSIVYDRDGDGTAEKVPFIFKLFHEHNGVWFWWGITNNRSKDFIELWRMTVDKLRLEGVNQMLVAYSPDIFLTPVDYLSRYPGSAYVDIMGHDNYHHFRTADSNLAAKSIKNLSLIGRAFGKPTGLTEMGQYVGGEITNDDFWTENILKPFTRSDIHKDVTFALFWRNQSPEHYFMVYPGHKSEENFKLFYDDPHTLFQVEAKNILYP